MINSSWKKQLLAVVAATVAVVFVASVAIAQQGGQQRGDQQQPGAWGQQGGFGQRGFGDMGAMQQRIGAAQPASIFATGEYVFVVRGNNLYQFDVKTLKLIKKVQLEEEVARAIGQPPPAP